MASGAKRLKLDDALSPGSGHAEDLAAVLQRLTMFLRNPGDGSGAGGLDALLEELGRLQSCLAGSNQADEAFKKIAAVQQRLQDAIVALQAAVDKFTPPVGYKPPVAGDATYVRGLLSYAHRLSYSSSAPLGYQPGQPLYFFKPPAPQEAEMRTSQLHAFAREWEARQQALEAQRQAAARGAAVPAAPQHPAAALKQGPAAGTAPAPAAGGGDLAASAAQLGLDLQQLLASMPAGWKPGDPIPLGPAVGAAAPGAAAVAAAGVPAAAAAGQSSAAPQAPPPAAAAPAAAAVREASPESEEAAARVAPRVSNIFLGGGFDMDAIEYGVSSDEEDSDNDDDDSDDSD